MKKVLLGRPSNNVKMGIVGLPNVGKSTFFNLLCNMHVAAENYPFCTVRRNDTVLIDAISAWQADYAMAWQSASGVTRESEPLTTSHQIYFCVPCVYYHSGQYAD